MAHAEAFSPILGIAQQPYFGMHLSQFLHHGRGAISGSVVDDEDLGMPITHSNATQNLAQSFADAGAFVVSRNNNGD
jgi:hypothetical protein